MRSKPIVTSIQPMLLKAIAKPALKRVVWAHGGTFVAAIYADAPALILNLARPDHKVALSNNSPVTDVAFRPTDYYAENDRCIEAAVACGKGSTGVQLVNLFNGDISMARATWAQSVAYSDLGRFLVCGAADGEVVVCDLLGLPKPVFSAKVSKLPIISVAAGLGALKHKEPLVAYAVASDGHVFRLKNKDEKKIETTDALAQLPKTDEEQRGCMLVAAHPDSDLAAFATWHRHLSSGRLSMRVVFGDFDGRQPELVVLPRDESNFVREIAFLPNRCQFAVCDEQAVEIWNCAATPKLMQRLEIDKKLKPYAAQQLDDKLLVVCA